MSDTAFQRIQNDKPRLARVLGDNADLCKVLAGLLGVLVIECQKRGLPLTAIRAGAVYAWGDGWFKSQISYTPGGLWTPVTTVPEKTDFMEYLAWKGTALAKVLETNVSVAALFESLAGRLESWAAFRGIPFKELRMHEDGAFISKDGELVLHVEKGQRDWNLLEQRKGFSKP